MWISSTVAAEVDGQWYIAVAKQAAIGHSHVVFLGADPVAVTVPVSWLRPLTPEGRGRLHTCALSMLRKAAAALRLSPTPSLPVGRTDRSARSQAARTRDVPDVLFLQSQAEQHQLLPALPGSWQICRFDPLGQHAGGNVQACVPCSCLPCLCKTGSPSWRGHLPCLLCRPWWSKYRDISEYSKQRYSGLGEGLKCRMSPHSSSVGHGA